MESVARHVTDCAMVQAMYVCMYVCMDGWMDGWMDGFMYACMYSQGLKEISQRKKFGSLRLKEK